jgi:hypothetical protein
MATISSPNRIPPAIGFLNAPKAQTKVAQGIALGIEHQKQRNALKGQTIWPS